MKIWPRMDCSVELILILELIGILEFAQGRGIIYSSDDFEDDQTRNEILTKRVAAKYAFYAIKKSEQSGCWFR